jgi:hypothetical protein
VPAVVKLILRDRFQPGISAQFRLEKPSVAKGRAPPTEEDGFVAGGPAKSQPDSRLRCKTSLLTAFRGPC